MWAPVQRAVLIADSVSSPELTANRVWRWLSIATNPAPAPVATVCGGRAQPAPTVALQRAPLMTETVPSLKLAT